MSTDLATPATSNDFSEVLATLRGLVHDHLLFFRLEVGRVILDGFFGGDTFAYRDRSPTKESKFNEFQLQHAEELDALGLKPWLLRQCVQVQIVYRTLPPAVRDQLGYSHTLALLPIGDPTLRAKLANEAISKAMPIGRFEETVAAAKAGTWYDTDDATPGVQPPPAPAVVALAQQPGRLVTRAEKWLADAQDLAAGWAAVPPDKVTDVQRARLKKVVVALRAQLAELDGKLGG